MIHPLELEVDNPVVVDMPHGVMRVTRGTEHVWAFAKSCDGAWRRVANARKTDGEYEWAVTPVAPLFDDDGYDSWAEVMRAVDALPVPVL